MKAEGLLDTYFQITCYTILLSKDKDYSIYLYLYFITNHSY